MNFLRALLKIQKLLSLKFFAQSKLFNKWLTIAIYIHDGLFKPVYIQLLRYFKIWKNTLKSLRSWMDTSLNKSSNKAPQRTSQRSAQLQPASPGPESTVKARARTPSIRVNDISLRQYHSGHPQWSAHLQPAP